MNDLVLMGVLRQQNKVMKEALEQIRDTQVYIWSSVAEKALEAAEEIANES